MPRRMVLARKAWKTHAIAQPAMTQFEKTRERPTPLTSVLCVHKCCQRCQCRKSGRRTFVSGFLANTNRKQYPI